MKCTRNPDVPDDAPAEKKYNNSSVYSRDLVLQPEAEGAAAEGSAARGGVRTVHDDILIAKLSPGQVCHTANSRT